MGSYYIILTHQVYHTRAVSSNNVRQAKNVYIAEESKSHIIIVFYKQKFLLNN